MTTFENFPWQNDQLDFKKKHSNQQSARIVDFCKIHMEVLKTICYNDNANFPFALHL